MAHLWPVYPQPGQRSMGGESTNKGKGGQQTKYPGTGKVRGNALQKIMAGPRKKENLGKRNKGGDERKDTNLGDNLGETRTAKRTKEAEKRTRKRTEHAESKKRDGNAPKAPKRRKPCTRGSWVNQIE